MKFGVRDICDVVFKAKDDMKIGASTFVAGQPVLYIDTATASSLEQATTTVYAQGGKGNTRLVTWEGEKTLTFTVTDALLSPISLSILSGAGLYKAAANETTKKVHVHTTATATATVASNTLTVDLSSSLGTDEAIDGTAPIFVSVLDSDGDITGQFQKGMAVADGGKKLTKATASGDVVTNGTKVFVDFYISRQASDVNEIQIDASSFGGNFYVEASTLFRSRETGTDMPAEITIPNVKIQSNFTFSMAATGDPSTFDFTMDAMPGYTYFDNTHKVMCVIQVIDDAAVAGNSVHDSVMKHADAENYFVVDGAVTDSVGTVG